MDTSTQILPEEHTLDQFIDKLEELCDCKGQGYVKALEVIKQLKSDLDNANEQLDAFQETFQVETYDELDRQIYDLKKQNEELKKENEQVKKENVLLKFHTEVLEKEAKKIEEAIRSSCGDALERCLPIWYGEDEDEDE